MPARHASFAVATAIVVLLTGPAAAQSGFPTEAGSWGGNVRAGPSVDARDIGSLAEGDRVTLLQRTDTVWNGYPWFRIRLSDGRTGYQWGGILCGLDAPIEGAFQTCDWAPSAEPAAAIGTEGNGTPRITSVYTDLAKNGCETIRRFEESGGTIQRCDGYAGVPLFVHDEDARIDVNAGRDNERWESPDVFNNVGDTIEWRLTDGDPFAIIYRYELHTELGPQPTRLAVKTIAADDRESCLVAWIDGDVAEANVLARERADARARSFRCGIDEAEWHRAGAWFAKDAAEGPMAVFGEPETDGSITLSCGPAGDLRLGIAAGADADVAPEIGLVLADSRMQASASVEGEGLPMLTASIEGTHPFLEDLRQAEYLTIVPPGYGKRTVPVTETVDRVLEACRSR